jgi:transcriptional regulator with XRE-family HTH domain
MLLRGLIGKVLRRTRLGQNRTLRDVAEAARVSVPYLSEVERGRKEPSSELLAAICSALDLELTDLLNEVRFEIARDRLAQLGLTRSAANPRPPYARPLNGHEVTNALTELTEPEADFAQELQGSVGLGGSFGGSLGGPSDGSFGGSFGSVMVAA